jgi:putative Mg2+ transporter-C (MgtC) family protein
MRGPLFSFVVPCCAATSPEKDSRWPVLRASVVTVVAAAFLCGRSPALADESANSASDEEVSIVASLRAVSSVLAISRGQAPGRAPAPATPSVSRYADEKTQARTLDGSFHAFSNPRVELEMLTRMAYAAMCGAIVGVERRAASATAGVRTLSLVSLGSAIFTLTAIFGLNAGPGAGRMGAAVSTGVGFLGAGAINRSGSGNRNLSTSASIWIAASLGLASASGLYRLALKGAMFTVFVLRWGTLLRYMRLAARKNWRRLLVLAWRVSRRTGAVRSDGPVSDPADGSAGS